MKKEKATFSVHVPNATPISSVISSKLQDIEKGIHDDKYCEDYCQEYKKEFGQELPDCQFKGNKSKIQNLIRKVHIDADGVETEVQFEGKTSMRTRMKNLFRR